MPRWAIYLGLILVLLSFLPLALIARSRGMASERPRIRLVQDMGKQPKYKPQADNPLFADGRAMRSPVPGTVARGEFGLEEPRSTGKTGAVWASGNALPVTMPLLRRGQERYAIYCAPCHGLAGFGDGLVARRADQLQEGTWVPPTSLHTGQVRARPDGHLFNTMSQGIRNMPGYAAQIPEDDRWAIVAYVRALQRSQNGRVEDVPPELRSSLR